MNVCVLGWYGSETLGDRAILDGIIRIFSVMSDELDFNIGSLYPVLTKRTIFEDQEMYKRHAKHLEIRYFDAKDKKQIKQAVEMSDYVIMGGGPLMDLQEMFIIRYGFHYAKKLNKRTALVGCGYGPLNQRTYKKCLMDIAGCSDAIIMRSDNCKEQMRKLISSKHPDKEVYSLLDPAIISVLDYKTSPLRTADSESTASDGKWMINVRDLDYVYAKKEFYYPRIKEAVAKIAKSVPKLILMPMHTFYVGGDDRYIQNRIAQDLQYDNITVIQKPLSLKEAYELISGAEGCVGMRYHSIVFQCFLNGNNYILDYTDLKNGKIKVFLDLIDTYGFYQSRYMNILNSETFDFSINSERFEYDGTGYLKSCEEYAQILLNLNGCNAN